MLRLVHTLELPQPETKRSPLTLHMCKIDDQQVLRKTEFAVSNSQHGLHALTVTEREKGMASVRHYNVYATEIWTEMS